MNRKQFKRILFVVAGTALAFVLLLIGHIVVMVKKMPDYTNPTVQLARADFQRPLQSTDVMAMEQKIQGMPGVKSTYYNQRDNIIVYAFDNTQNSSVDIYNACIRDCGYPSVRYTVNDEDLKNGCPVISDNSFYGRLTNIVASIVK